MVKKEGDEREGWVLREEEEKQAAQPAFVQQNGGYVQTQPMHANEGLHGTESAGSTPEKQIPNPYAAGHAA